jgi:hypothetical protein
MRKEFSDAQNPVMSRISPTTDSVRVIPYEARLWKRECPSNHKISMLAGPLYWYRVDDRKFAIPFRRCDSASFVLRILGPSSSPPTRLVKTPLVVVPLFTSPPLIVVPANVMAFPAKTAWPSQSKSERSNSAVGAKLTNCFTNP